MNHRETQHELWLAMRSAYITYRHAANAFDAAMSCSSQTVSPWDRTVRITILAAAQLAAFENYVEARLDYSEFFRDSNVILGAAAHDPKPEITSRAKILITRPVLRVAAVALMSIIGFTYALAVHERRRTPSADTPLTQERVPKFHDPIQAASEPSPRNVDAVNAAHKPDIPELAMAPPEPHSPPTAIPRDNTTQKRTLQSRHTRATVHSESTRVATRRHNDYEFELTPSRKFKQIGAVSLSLRMVDAKRKSLDLLISVDRSRLQKKHLRLNTPVQLVAAEGSRPIKLVVTAINWNGVHIHLSQSDSDRRIPGIACAGNCLVDSSNQDRQEIGRGGFNQRPLDTTVRRPARIGDDSTR